MDGIRMKYKSTAHAVVALKGALYPYWDDEKGQDVAVGEQVPHLYMAEIYRAANEDTDFGGKTEEALQSNLWIPAGPAVRLDDDGQTGNIEYCWGDTWYQRYDCLKTYSYTTEDKNSIIEIGSFMVETHVNIDGRYDKNRGQDNNLNMSP